MTCPSPPNSQVHQVCKQRNVNNSNPPSTPTHTVSPFPVFPNSVPFFLRSSPSPLPWGSLRSAVAFHFNRLEMSSGEHNIRGLPTHGGRYVQYNVYGNLFEVSRKYVPPIRPIGRGAYGLVWYFSLLLLRVPPSFPLSPYFPGPSWRRIFYSTDIGFWSLYSLPRLERLIYLLLDIYGVYIIFTAAAAKQYSITTYNMTGPGSPRKMPDLLLVCWSMYSDCAFGDRGFRLQLNSGSRWSWIDASVV